MTMSNSYTQSNTLLRIITYDSPLQLDVKPQHLRSIKFLVGFVFYTLIAMFYKTVCPKCLGWDMMNLN